MALNNANLVLAARSLSWLGLVLQMWLEEDRLPPVTTLVTVKAHDIENCTVVSLAGSDVETLDGASSLKSDLCSTYP